MPNWSKTSMQDTNSPSMEQIFFFYDHAMIILTLISILTFYMISSTLKMKKFNTFTTEGQMIETVWTILPALMLVFIAMPSLKTLYMMEDTKSSKVSIKTIGHQWYWSYEYMLPKKKETENFMESSNITRLMKTSELLYMPINTTNRMLVTSDDVIHSWTIPTLGVKSDALPGRLNQVFNTPKRLGLFTGQCSEICGANHSFMPILLQVVSSKQFIEKISLI